MKSNHLQRVIKELRKITRPRNRRSMERYLVCWIKEQQEKVSIEMGNTKNIGALTTHPHILYQSLGTKSGKGSKLLLIPCYYRTFRDSLNSSLWKQRTVMEDK